MPLALLLSGSVASAALTLKYTFDDITGANVPNTAPGATINGTLVTGVGGLSPIVETGPSVVVGGISYPLGKIVRFGNQGGYNDGWGDADAPHINTNAAQSLWGITGSTQYTAMAWVQFYSQAGDNMVFGNNAGGGRLHLGSRDTRYWSGHWGDDVEGTNIATDTANWHHVAWTNDGSNNQQIYLDGVEMTGAAGGGVGGGGTGGLDNAVNLIIGSSGNGGSFNGAVDDVKVFNTRLTTAEIQAERTSTLIVAAPTVTIFSAAPSTVGTEFFVTLVLKDGTGAGHQVVPGAITNVTFDGAAAATISANKVGDTTTVLAKLAGPYIPGQHVYSVHILGTEAGGSPYDLSKDVTGPILPPVADLAAPFSNTPSLPWGVREYTTTAANGGTALGIVLTNAGPAANTENAVVNFNDPQAPGDRGDFNNDVPFPGNTAADDNHVVCAKTRVSVAGPSSLSFNLRTDDGCALKITGATCTAAFGASLDPADSSMVLNQVVTSARVTYSFPAAGTYDVAYISFDGGGGGSMELSWAAGSVTSADERQLPWELVGNPSHPSVPPTTSAYPAFLPGPAGTAGRWGLRTYRTQGFENVDNLAQTMAFLTTPAVIAWTPTNPLVTVNRTGWAHPGITSLGSDTLTTPSAEIPPGGGTTTLTFVHRHNFEADGTNWDGGAVQYSINGAPFVDLSGASFTQNGYTGTVGGTGPLNGKSAFTGPSAGYLSNSVITSVATIPGLAVGDDLQVRFIGAWDESFAPGAPNWQITSVLLTSGASTVYDSAFTPVSNGGLTGTGSWAFAASSQSTRTGVIDTLTPELNYRDPNTNGDGGVLVNSKPFPGDTPADDDRVVTVGHCRITVPTSGDYTFNEHSDDGFFLRIKAVTGPNPVFRRVSGGGGRTMSAPNEMYFTAGTGDADTRGIMFLNAGQYDVEYVNWEGGGGFFYQLTVAAGAFIDNFGVNGTDNWVPVGHTPDGIVLTQPSMESPWDVQTSAPGALVGGTAPLFPASEATPLGAAIQYPAINFADPQAGSASSFGGNVPFANDTGADDNQFVVKANGYLHIEVEGDYLIGFRGDDGGYFTIFGAPAAGFSRIVENATGSAAIVDAAGGIRNRLATDVATGDSLSSAVIHLVPDDYPVTTLFYEIGGGASYEVFGSAVSTASVTPAKAFNRILLANAASIPTFTPDLISGFDLAGPPAPTDLSKGYASFSFGQGDAYSLSFPSTTGLSYALEYSTDLVNWYVAGATYGSSGASTTFTGQLSALHPALPAGSPRIYWRVRGAY